MEEKNTHKTIKILSRRKMLMFRVVLQRNFSKLEMKLNDEQRNNEPTTRAFHFAAQKAFHFISQLKKLSF